MVSLKSKLSAFAAGSAVPYVRTARAKHVCRASASVETSPQVALSVDTERTESKAVLSIAAACKTETSKFLRDISAAVSESGLTPKRVNVLRLDTTESMTTEFFLDDSVSDAELGALQARVDAVFTALPEPPPAADESNELASVPYDVIEVKPLAAETLEAGAYFNVDPYAHPKWTTVTTICPTDKGLAEKVMGVLASQNLNIIFCTVRSVNDCRTGFATDVYYVQTLQGKPLTENERNTLHNTLVEVLEA